MHGLSHFIMGCLGALGALLVAVVGWKGLAGQTLESEGSHSDADEDESCQRGPVPGSVGQG